MSTNWFWVLQSIFTLGSGSTLIKSEYDFCMSGR